MRRLAPALLASLLLALAQPASPAGVNLRWTRCYGDGGVLNRAFACNTNSGINLMVGSFVLDNPLPQVSANQFTLDITTAAASLPAWWQIRNTGSCRPNALGTNTSANPSDTVCVDWSQGQASGGIGSFTIGTLGPNTARIVGIFAVPQTAVVDLPANHEYFSFNVTINNVKSAGSACTGCSIPACIALSSIQVYTDAGNSSVTYTTPAYGTNTNYISWQGGDGVVPFANGTCAGFDTAGFAINTSVVGRGSVARSRTKNQYPAGSPVTLTAVPLPGDRFVAWSGDGSGSDPSLNVIVEEPLNITATFDRDPAAAASVVSVSDVPADQGSQVQVHWNRSPMDGTTFPAVLCCYQVQRRPSTPPGSAWVAAASEVTGLGYPDYTQVVATTADATASDPALFSFRVMARTEDDSAEWLSNEVQGASVDNIAPPAPASVTGTISSGFATFFWPAVNAPDLDHYAVYRGLEALPPIDDAHRVGTPTLPGFSDAPGYYANYRVTAVDVHGNEGAATLFVPSNTTGVDGGAPPAALSVGNPTPSPMRRQMSMSLGLPRPMSATVEVVDAQGRVVRRLHDGVSQAGWLLITWDAADARGRDVPAGIYFVRVRTPEGERIKRLALLP